jgi:hypothetical protein
MLVCPHCKKTLMKEDIHLTEESLKLALGLSNTKFTDKTKSLIYRLLKLTENATTATATKFLARVSNYSDEQINYGISKFFSMEYHMKGYEYEWCAGMIRRENNYKQSQLKNKLSGIPRER